MNMELLRVLEQMTVPACAETHLTMQRLARLMMVSTGIRLEQVYSNGHCKQHADIPCCSCLSLKRPANIEFKSSCLAGELAVTCSTIARRLIWFHHILSTTKRKCIINWGSELELGGYCVPGHPGVLICEGLSHQAVFQSFTLSLVNS